MSNFNEQAILEQANQLAYTRTQSFGLSAEEAEGYAQFVASFNQVAVSELAKEPGIQLQEGADPIPLNDAIALQALTLFGEGVLYCILRCREYNLPGELSEQFTQQVAMHVYEQAKQVVAATHGQEHTPEFQFTQAQQIEFMTQGAESALIHYINEYEKAYGPLNPEPESDSELPSPDEAMEPDQPGTPGSPEPMENPQPLAIAEPAKSSAKHSTSELKNHEKYAAVALLLSTLQVQQRAKMLKMFTPDEKELIAFYSAPEQIEQHLDLQKVRAHLKKLKSLIGKTEKKTPSNAHKGIHALAGLISQQKLLSCVKDERPVVQKYLIAHYEGPTGETEDIEGASVPSLSPRLESIIYHYLAKQFAYELQQSLPNPGSPQP